MDRSSMFVLLTICFITIHSAGIDSNGDLLPYCGTTKGECSAKSCVVYRDQVTREALKCYVCNSKQDPRCLDPTDEKSPMELTDCTTDQRQRAETRQAIQKISEMLQKLGSPSIPLSMDKNPAQIWESEKYPMACQKLEIKAAGDFVLGRGCSAPRMERFDPCEAVKLITNEGIELESCSLCDTDGCNGGISLRSFSFGLILTFLLMLMIT